MTASAMSPARPANSASATASGRMARCVAATPSDGLMMSIFPPLAGYRFASAAAAATNLPMPAPGRSRTPAWAPYVPRRAAAVAVNGGLSRAVGSALVPTPGTIWVSKVTTADTRKARGEASWGSGLPVLGLFGISSRCSRPPGRRCSASASFWLIMACPAARGLNSRPARILTRSAEMPRARSGLEMVCTGTSCWPRWVGSTAW